jgi:acyl-coenzyme A thioesterase PaaI-like protein
VHVAFPFAAQFCSAERVHARGAIASVADSGNGYTAYTLASADTDVLAVEFKINLLAPARGAGFLACGRGVAVTRLVKQSTLNLRKYQRPTQEAT